MKNCCLLLTLLLILLGSCTKDPVELTPEEDSGVLVFRDYDNEHQVSIQRWTLNNIPRNLKLNGQFYNDGSPIPNSLFRVNGIEVTYTEGYGFVEQFHNSNEGFEDLNAAHDGQLVNVEVEVDGTTEDISIYSPADLIVETSQNLDSLNRSEDLTIEWNSDLQNPYGDISIQLISRGVDGKPDEETANLHHAVVIEDSGSYTIPASEYENWPIGLHLDLVLMRANERLLPETKTLITAYTHTLETGEVTE